MFKQIIILATFGIALISLQGCSHTKLIVKSESGKNKIKEGATGAITLKGEAYPFPDCKSICKDCDSLYKSSRWEFDKLGPDQLVLKRVLEFKYDTLTQDEFKAQQRSTRWENFDKLISFNKEPLYIYQTPTKIDTMTLKFIDIETLTYSYKDKCYKGGPFQSMFANPNKIRKVEMQGAEFKLKVP
jgi:hypothetical protein